MDPILKWAGGKRQLLADIKSIITPEVLKGHKYYEPFLGGGSVAFSLLHNQCVLNDLNKELINVYEVIKNEPYELIKKLKEHQMNHSHDYYYLIRNQDRDASYYEMSNVAKAARTIYLNRTCYNGLYRVNSRGFYNVPIGKTTSKHNDIVMEGRILELSKYLNNKNIKLTNCDFTECLKTAKKGDVIYFDPPYDYEVDGFKQYLKSGFNHDDLRRLKEACDKLISKGCFVIVSNNDTSFVRECFSDDYYKISEVIAKRYINCDGKKRSMAREVIIYGKK